MSKELKREVIVKKDSVSGERREEKHRKREMGETERKREGGSEFYVN